MRLSFERWFQKSSYEPDGGAQDGRAGTGACCRGARDRDPVWCWVRQDRWSRFLLTRGEFCLCIFQAQDVPKTVMSGSMIFSRGKPFDGLPALGVHGEAGLNPSSWRSWGKVHLSQVSGLWVSESTLFRSSVHDSRWCGWICVLCLTESHA